MRPEHRPTSTTHRLGVLIGGLSALLLTACNHDTFDVEQGTHEIARTELVQSARNTTDSDIIGKDGRIVVDGNKLSYKLPGRQERNIRAYEPIEGGVWYTLLAVQGAKVRTKFVQGEEYDMVTEAFGSELDGTIVTYIYFR